MVGLLIYMLKVAAVLVVFHLFYRVLLRKERTFGTNRLVLLMTLVLAFVLPLCEITVTKTVAEGLDVASHFEGVGDSEWGRTANQQNMWLAAFVVYGVGCAAVASYMIYSMICVVRIIRGGEKHSIGGGVNLRVTHKRFTPFSWLNSVVISQIDYRGAGSDAIIAHEKAHIERRHCYDLLFVNLCCAVQWFNPAIWLLRKDLQAVHEYEADRAVLQAGYDAREYQLLLITRAFGGGAFYIANSLKHSTIKNRIHMMLMKSSGSASSRFKLLYLVPLMALALIVFSKTVIVNQPPTADEKTAPAENMQIVRVVINSAGSVSVQFGSDGRNVDFGTDHASLERYLDARIDPQRTGEYVVRIQAHPRVQMGMVTDVKIVLYKLGVKTYTYATIAE